MRHSFRRSLRRYTCILPTVAISAVVIFAAMLLRGTLTDNNTDDFSFPHDEVSAISPPPISTSMAGGSPLTRIARTDRIVFSERHHDMMFQSRRYVLTTFFRPTGGPNASFYHGRKVPSFDWVVVFLASFLDVSDGDEKIVFFCDMATYEALAAHVSQVRDGRYVEPILRSGRVHFVVVEDGDAPLRGSHTASEGRVVVGRPSYFDESWANNVPNAANNFRFAFYRDFVEEWERRHQQVAGAQSCSSKAMFLLSDNTDVAFQLNPFAVGDTVPQKKPGGSQAIMYNVSSCLPASCQLDTPFVVFTLEHNSKTFQNEKYNRRWMSCYGASVLRDVAAARRPISCAGVTLGDSIGIAHYLKAQLQELRQPSLLACQREVIGATLDQATHNKILHDALTLGDRGKPTSLVVKVERVSNATAFVSPHSSGPKFRSSMNAEEEVGVAACTFHGNFGKALFGEASTVKHRFGNSSVRTLLTNRNGVPYTIVHQYTSNRVPAMMKLMRERYL